MKYFVITVNDALAGVTVVPPTDWNIPNASIHEFEDKIPDLNIHSWDAENDCFVQSAKIYTKLQFLSRLTIGERMAIRASTDPVVNDIMSLLDVAEYISTNDPNTIQGIQYLYSVGLLTVERMTEVLN